VNTL
jgi:CII-binding regulator of phage lambda lysogenization HflD